MRILHNILMGIVLASMLFAFGCCCAGDALDDEYPPDYNPTAHNEGGGGSDGNCETMRVCVTQPVFDDAGCGCATATPESGAWAPATVAGAAALGALGIGWARRRLQ